jgi:Fatty acid desaturase
VNLHPEELHLARAWSDDRPFEGLTPEQLQSIHARARALHRWVRAHPLAHSAISIAVLVFLFATDYWILLRLPAFFLPDGPSSSLAAMLLAGIVSGSLHSYLLYSMAFFTMHDGYSHKVLFPMNTRLGRWAHVVGSNLCRIASAEPQYFAKYHLPHHLKFGTEEDGEFLNFVMPRRYWLSLLPLAAITNFNDFLIHRPPTYTRSRLVSVAMALTYNGVYAWFSAHAFGWPFAVTVMVLLPHVGFYLDRLRQFTEHNLMPLENENGARSLGLGFWGMLLGGGPWGSPCHLEHHLAVGLPWYGQLLLHVHLRSLLTPRQREQFLLQPVIGWPKLWWTIMRQSYAFRRRVAPAE